MAYLVYAQSGHIRNTTKENVERISRMKALLRSYICWPKMDKETENLAKGCRGCALPAKLSNMKWELWPKVNVPWSRQHISFTGPLNSSYYLLVVNSFSK